MIVMGYKEDLERFKSTHSYKTTIVDGVKFPYLLCGKGEQTLVFLVGGMGISTMWMHYVWALEQNYQILTFDYPVEYSNNQELCSGIAGLMEQIGIESAVFIGSSYGGYLAQIFARRYREKTAGLCLFSTAGLNADTLEVLSAKAKHVNLLLGIMKTIPYGLLKPIFKRACMKHLVNATQEEHQYMKELFTEIFKDYNAELDIHMTKLLADIVVQKPCTAEEFAYLDGKVLLILPDEDDSFTSKMQSDLIEMMKNPMIEKHMEGGHLATVLRTKDYVKVIHKFMGERVFGTPKITGN